MKIAFEFGRFKKKCIPQKNASATGSSGKGVYRSESRFEALNSN